MELFVDLSPQPEVQRELEKREWAEPNDNVMAEYVTVLLGEFTKNAAEDRQLTKQPTAIRGVRLGRGPVQCQDILLTSGRESAYRDGRS